jgi:hypothetical protein
MLVLIGKFFAFCVPASIRCILGGHEPIWTDHDRANSISHFTCERCGKSLGMF